MHMAMYYKYERFSIASLKLHDDMQVPPQQS